MQDADLILPVSDVMIVVMARAKMANVLVSALNFGNSLNCVFMSRSSSLMF